MNAPGVPTVDLQAILRDTNVQEVLQELDRELVGLAPVKKRIEDIAAFLVVSKARAGDTRYARRGSSTMAVPCTGFSPRSFSSVTSRCTAPVPVPSKSPSPFTSVTSATQRSRSSW